MWVIDWTLFKKQSIYFKGQSNHETCLTKTSVSSLSSVYADKLYYVMNLGYTSVSVGMRILLTLRSYRNPNETIHEATEHRITIRQFIEPSYKLQAGALQLYCHWDFYKFTKRKKISPSINQELKKYYSISI